MFLPNCGSRDGEDSLYSVWLCRVLSMVADLVCTTTSESAYLFPCSVELTNARVRTPTLPDKFNRGFRCGVYTCGAN